jgi:serine/threonine-protein phosphatase 2A regulatory subunit A
MDTLNPMDVLKEDMESEEVSMRVNAIHRLRVVALLMGTDKIKSVLVPYLDCIKLDTLDIELIKKEEDEVLFALADELGTLVTLIPNQPLLLLP